MRGPVLACLLWACAHPVPPPVQPATLRPEARAAAVAGVQDPALVALLADHWAFVLDSSPEWATVLGEPGRAGEVDDVGPAARAAARATRDALLKRALALDPAPLSDTDRDSLDMLRFQLQSDADDDVCHFHQWSLSARSNAVGWANGLYQDFPTMDPAAGAALLARYRAVPRRVDQDIANLREGIAAGRSPDAEALRRTLALVDAELARPLAELELLAPSRAPRPEGWQDAAWAAWRADLAQEVESRVLPAWRRYRAFLADELAPVARSGAVGLTGLPDGAACYAARVRRFTTLDLDADAVHAAGLADIAANHAALAVLGARAFGLADAAAVLARLRQDPDLGFDSEAAVVQAARDALADAQAALPGSFGRLPQAACEVEEMPAFEAPYSTIAYYRQPLPDGARPGAYVVNSSQPATRPRFEARALAFHESVPGHHLQIAIGQELAATPAFRRHVGATAFVEGWALYAEVLAGEQGLYRDDLDRLGMLSFDAWRASRLVVDTGIHHLGWSRQQAVDYMRENTPLALNNIDNEVDRYISWPGQALAYKTGQREILALRAMARERLGDRFDQRAFHDVVLGGGAVTLPVLRRRVEAWVAAVADAS